MTTPFNWLNSLKQTLGWYFAGLIGFAVGFLYKYGFIGFGTMFSTLMVNWRFALGYGAAFFFLLIITHFFKNKMSQ